LTAPTPDSEGACIPFDPAPLAARVHAALDSYLRERAPDQRLAFWKAIALGYGGSFESLAGCPTPPSTGTSS
jgi:hypothetical protein